MAISLVTGKQYHSPAPMTFSGLKSLADGWAGYVKQFYPIDDRMLREMIRAEFEWDWLREAAMSALELGAPLRLDAVVRLLTDLQYFESLLPLPASDPRWQSPTMTGTEMLWRWWNVYTAEQRDVQLGFIRKIVQAVPPDAFHCFSLFQLRQGN